MRYIRKIDCRKKEIIYNLNAGSNLMGIGTSGYCGY